MHAQARGFVESSLRGSGRWGKVVEIGGRDINGGVRDLVVSDEYISIDLEPGPGVNVVADCRDWSPPWQADLVLCLEVLEHADDPAGVVKAAVSYLAPGGRLILTCAGPGRLPHSGHDGGTVREGEHYGNIDPSDLAQWLRDAGVHDSFIGYLAGACDVRAVGTRDPR